MKEKRTKAFLLVSLLLAVSIFFGTVENAGINTANAKSSIDSKASRTDRDVDKIMENELYKITDKDPKTIKLPQSIPDELMDKLKYDLNKYSHAAAMVYVDLETGFTIKYNSARSFRGASLVKAPYMMAVLSKIKDGELSLSKRITYNTSYNRTGTVQIPYDYESGESMDLKRLIEYLIYYSDNTAFALLQVHCCSLSSFYKFALNRYNEEFFKDNKNWLNANGVAAAFVDLYKKAKSGDRLYVWFLELLKQANENKFIKSGIPTDENGESIYEVAHKYGEDVNSLNDAAIIFYGERPYLLIILNDYLSNSARPIFTEVSTDIYNIHQYIVNYDIEPLD